MVKIGTDIGYTKAILAAVFKCVLCGSRLLMFGCDTKGCDNYWKKKL